MTCAGSIVSILGMMFDSMMSSRSGMSSSMHIAEECLKDDKTSAQQTDAAEVLAQTIDTGTLNPAVRVQFPYSKQS